MSEIELHRKLLGDRVRNDALAAALKSVVTEGCTVADLGAGTGFLSFLARRLGAAQCHLYEYSGALGLARALAAANGIDGLTFVEAHSREVRKPPRADVVISETLGNFALEEGLLETVADAHRFLKPGGTLLPCGLVQYVAPVLDGRLQREIDIWGAVGHGLDLGHAREIGLNNMYVKTVKSAELGPAQDWDTIAFDPAAAKPPSSLRRGAAAWPAGELRGQPVHGFALWWEVQLVPGIAISTAPDRPATHWEQVYLPLREPLAPGPDQRVELDLVSDTRAGVRLQWEAHVAPAKPVRVQRLDTARGRL